MSTIWLIVIAIVVFIVAYLTYGSFIIRKLEVDTGLNLPPRRYVDG